VRETKYSKLRQLGFSYKMSDTPPRDRNPAPALGQHTDELLAALGISDDERARLRQAGVTRMGDTSSDY
jgi:crotonobetainyl-CoA:carnitine CoA-transferase CaiB-like acyl-CoA transferase